jgi:hypothetical protein
LPVRTGNSYSVPGRGTVTRSKSGKAKTYTGKGPAPAGTKKVEEKDYTEVPTVTVTQTSSGSSKVTTSGYGSQKAARRAEKATERRQRRIRAILSTDLSKPQTRSQAVRQLKQMDRPLPGPSASRSTSHVQSNPAKAVISSYSNPKVKPETFKGKKTAGAPTRAELQTAAKQGGLKTNKAGFVTTPKVRKTAGKVKRLEAKARKSTGPLPGLGPEESKNARTVFRRGEKKGATYKELLASSETGLVESGFKNLDYGDADSEGWRQERTSIYGTREPRNVKAGADNFFEESISDTGGARGRGMTAGELAQAIQGSAFPERYDERKPEAVAILRAYKKGQPTPKLRAKLKKAQGEAAKLGLNVGGQGKVGKPSKQVVTRFKAAKIAMKDVEGTPYVWGGGHNAGKVDPSGGLDCSGAVSYVLQHVGVELPGGVTSGEMGNYLKPGPGLLTVYYNAGHTFLKLGDEYWGTSVGDSGAGGLGPHGAPSDSYLSEYSVAHVPGMGRKQLLQMGYKPGKSFASPGITYSQGGTVATVDPSAAVTKSGKPGFSKQPIALTPRQKMNRANRKLKALSTPSAEAPTSSILDDLERKYGVAVV